MHRTIAALLVGSLLLVACGGDDDASTDDKPTSVAAAEARVESAQEAVAEAQTALDESHDAFCTDASDYIDAIDRYARLLEGAAAATVGDVRVAGADLAAPREAAGEAGVAVVAAQDELAQAQQELVEAEAALAEAQSSTTGAPPETTTTTTLVPPATVDRVEKAEADLDAAREGITDQTPLVEAGEQFNAAAVSLEVAWLRFLVDAGCLSDDQRTEAVNAVAEYTLALQTQLQAAGYYDGELDGVYGPSTVEAVETLQAANELPVTGLPDRATSVALDAAALAAGVEQSANALTYTAAVQSALVLLGYWDGPVDGVWSEELSAAVVALQTELGVPATGALDAATAAAIVQRVEDAQEAATSTTETTSTTAESTPTTAESSTTTEPVDE